jgi:hypothetical protein
LSLKDLDSEIKKILRKVGVTSELAVGSELTKAEII